MTHRDRTIPIMSFHLAERGVRRRRWMALVLVAGLLSGPIACGCGADGDEASHGAVGETAGAHRSERSSSGESGSGEPGSEEIGSAVHRSEEHREGVVALSRDQLDSAALATVSVEARRLSHQLETTGEVGYEEDRIAHVGPRVPGRVHQVPVSLGDEVRRGQVLVILDSVELGKAKAEYLAARTREDLARRNVERERRLYEDRITSEREMLEAQATHLEAVSMRQSAQEALRLYGMATETIEGLEPGDQDASLLPVAAPIDGRVVEKHATLGELATPADTLFTVADLGHVWIWIDVYERDLATVHLGDRVEVVVDPFPRRVFSGEVTYLSPEVASETRTVRARIDVENREALLRPGMFATVRLVDHHSEDETAALVVPEGALVRDGRDGRRTLVFVPVAEPAGGDGAGMEFEARPVRVGRREGGLVEVVSGLSAGEVVVSEGTFLLKSELAREELGGGHSH